jgi:phosphonate transport system ATP-binding protein
LPSSCLKFFMSTNLTNVTVRLGRDADARTVLDAVSLSLAAGEQVAIIGPSGAGKTTLLHTLACAIKPVSGELTVNKETPWALSKSALHELRARIFLAPQAPPLPPRQRVVNAVLAGRLASTSILGALLSLYKPKDAALAFDALSRFKLEDKLWLRCDRLSGGERQRVGLARMMVSTAPLILLDEPVSALDPALGLSALKTIQDEATARNATLVVSLHDVQLARARFARLIGLKAGRIHFDLPASAVDEAILADLYGAEFAEAAGMARPNTATVELPSVVAAPSAARCF